MAAPPDATPVADEGGVHHVTRVALVVLAIVAFGLVAHLTVVSRLQQRSAQQHAFDQLRLTLAEGTAAVGQTDAKGRLVASGTPIALIDIPAIHLHQVVLQGTAGTVLMAGPGHRRDSPMPGQAGTSVVFGRQASYGGPFRRLGELQKGAMVTVTTGEGVSTFRVIGVRRAGDTGPPVLAAGQGRILLVTAAGTRFVPSGVLRVDADLVSPTLAGSTSVISARDLGPSEQILATDSSTLWALILWLQALIAIAVAASWSWVHWGRRQAWIVFVPMTALVGLLATTQFMRLLPNLL